MKPVVAVFLWAATAVAIYDERCEQEIDHGPCKGFEPRYFYNKHTGECELSYYGGCLGNDNSFKSKKQCERTCIRRRDFADVVLERIGRVPLKRIDVREPSSPICYQPLKRGPCLGYLQRYGYDVKERKCVEFTYGGCGGNQNNFERMRECEFTCMVDMPTTRN
ncbi:Kunitz/Bovine pancreatic trypsin inhibitor domain protein [Ancylostoma duodenale]|uniref:Kunitz/Bovine pancreatic trypsin inhibitor domain protein n=1 Tax=Ancylostoma duodenale TaxID=51022 RepID=A0A0C2H0V7_9BILA|nr:Kunitz/Bovine pancreatic trypsin inhibitor domain protein [Ancylostoma duodenale]